MAWIVRLQCKCANASADHKRATLPNDETHLGLSDLDGGLGGGGHGGGDGHGCLGPFDF